MYGDRWPRDSDDDKNEFLKHHIGLISRQLDSLYYTRDRDAYLYIIFIVLQNEIYKRRCKILWH